jgi:hypothetical protein
VLGELPLRRFGGARALQREAAAQLLPMEQRWAKLSELRFE